VNQRVIAVAAVDALGSAQIVVPLQLHAGNLFGHVYQLVDGHQFTGTKVDGRQNVALEEIDDALGAVVDIHEAAGLMAVAQISISCLPECLASSTLRLMAAGAFSRPPIHVPSGP